MESKPTTKGPKRTLWHWLLFMILMMPPTTGGAHTVNVVRGVTVTLACHFTRSPTDMTPLKLKWVFKSETTGARTMLIEYADDRITIPRGVHDRVHFSSPNPQTGTASLTLTDVEDEDSGLYDCQVHKGKMVQSKHIQLNAMGQMPPPRCVIPTRVEVNKKVRLKCGVAPGTRTTHIEWVKMPEKRVLLHYVDWKGFVIIDVLNDGEAATYRCIAKNPASENYCEHTFNPKPTTMAPTTMAPTTMAPTTMAPTTMAPTTMAPTTMAPTTMAPTTMAPTTTATTTLEPERDTTPPPGGRSTTPPPVTVTEGFNSTESHHVSQPTSPMTSPQTTVHTTVAPVVTKGGGFHLDSIITAILLKAHAVLIPVATVLFIVAAGILCLSGRELDDGPDHSYESGKREARDFTEDCEEGNSHTDSPGGTVGMVNIDYVRSCTPLNRKLQKLPCQGDSEAVYMSEDVYV